MLEYHELAKESRLEGRWFTFNRLTYVVILMDPTVSQLIFFFFRQVRKLLRVSFYQLMLLFPAYFRARPFHLAQICLNLDFYMLLCRQISDSPMSAVSGDHDDDEDGGKKDGVGVPQLIVDTGNPTESQAEQTLAKGILPTVEEVSQQGLVKITWCLFAHLCTQWNLQKFCCHFIHALSPLLLYSQ